MVFDGICTHMNDVVPPYTGEPLTEAKNGTSIPSAVP